jgi:PAS domain S-box-containing protein
MKIILITVAIILFAIGTNAIITNYTFSKEYSAALQSKTLVTGQNLKFQLDKVLSLGIPLKDLTGFEEQCRELTNKYKEISYAMVVDTDGIILFHNDPSQMGKQLADTKTLNALKREKETIQIYSENGKEYYDIFIPVFGTEAEHIGAVRIGFPIDIINQKIGQLLVYSAIVAGISFIVAIVLLLFALSIWVTQPLTRLIDAIQEISTGRAGLERRVEIYSEDEIGEVASAFNRMVEDLQKTTVSKNYMDDILKSMFDMLVVLTPDNTIRTVNKTTCDILGYAAEEMVGQPLEMLLADENLQPKGAWIDELVEKGAFNNTEKVFTTKNGRKIPVVFSASVMRNNEGTIRGIVCVAHDITERKQAEELLKHFNEELEQNVKTRTEQLNASLEEKVVLLREIHHRVKNNLQIIISLTNLQMHQIDDPKVKQIMVETQNRVRAMSFVHEKLYRSEDISHINLADYTRFLATHLFSFYGVDSRQVSLKIEIGKILLDINTAIPVGLIINELVSNTIKHAFPEGRKGEIWISVGQQDHTLTILFGDDGIGIPQDIDWRTVPSLGLRLVILLVNQLNGTIELDRSAGTLFKIVIQEKG